MEYLIMARRRKLTPRILRKIIAEESRKINETLEMGLKHPSEAPKRTKEVDASKYADSLEACMDYYKMCCIKEEKVLEHLKIIREAKRRLKKKLISKI
jgi:hypothetical protein